MIEFTTDTVTVTHGARTQTFARSSAEVDTVARLLDIKWRDPRAYAIAYYLRHDVLARYRSLHALIWEAAELVAQRAIFEPYECDDIGTLARIPRILPPPTMHGRLEAVSARACTCDLHFYGNAPRVDGQPLCTHLIAYKMHKILKRPLTPQTMRKIDERGQATCHNQP